QVGGGIGAGDRVAGAFEPVNDRHVARQHVRQVFQQPQRREVVDAVTAPALQIEFVRVGVAARGGQGGGQLVEVDVDEPRADVAAEAGGGNVGGVSVGLGFQARILERIVRRDHGQLDVAGHHLGGLAVALGDVVADLVRRHLAADL